MVRSRVAVLVGAFVALWCLAPASADAQPSRGPELIGSRLVLALVTDTGNRPPTELEPDDFVIEEGGQPREILSLHLADYPIVVLLDDVSASSKDADAIRGAAARFIARIGERPIGVGTLTDADQLFAPLDLSRSGVLDLVRRFSTAASTPRPLQAAAAAVRAARDTGAPFSAIVIVSTRAIGSTQIAPGESLAPILASGVPVYVVALRDASTENDDVLRALAEQTRGQYTTIFSSASFSIALDRLADRLSSELLIEYVVPAGAPPAGDVRVGVRIPGAKAIGLGVSK